MAGIDQYTKLLLHCNGPDGIGNKDVTAVNNAQIDTAQKRFGTASGLFDGDDDYLTIPDSADWTLGTENFTIDLWVRFNAVDVVQQICGQDIDTANDWLFRYDTAGTLTFFWEVGNNILVNLTGTFEPEVNTWYHIAVIRNGDTLGFFVDGTLTVEGWQALTENVDFADIGGSPLFAIGVRSINNTADFNGWMDEFRFSKGIARWIENFTPPTSAYISDSYTKLLLSCNGEDGSTIFADSSGFYDSSESPHPIVTHNDAQLDMAQKEFGTASGLFDGTDDYLTAPHSDDWDFGTGDFTIDFWVRFNALPSDGISQFFVCNSHSDDSGWMFFVLNTTGTYSLQFKNYTGAAYNIEVSVDSTGLSTNTWYHIAVSRNGSNFYIFQDGVQQGVTAVDADETTDNVAGIYIGSNRVGGAAFNGWIDEFRISKGTARWITGFTPPTEEYILTTPRTILAKAEITLDITYSITIEAKASIKNAVLMSVQAKEQVKKSFTQTVTTIANIQISSLQTVNVKANILSSFIKTIQAKAKINYLPPSYIAEVSKTVRQFTPKVEIQWDGATWVDESDYFISAGGNEQLWKISGEGIAATLDVELDNTTERFTPDNASSPIYQYLKPRTNIRVYITAGGYDYRIFTGYIKNIHPDVRSRICSLECFDNQVSVYNKIANGIVYEDNRSDQLLTTLSGLADLTSDQFDFDIGTLVVNFGYFEDRNVWPIMGEIAVAERGRVFFDRDGILRFWNRDKLHNETARDIIPNITLSDWIVDLDYSVSEHEIKNKVIVKAMPRASAGLQVVWSSGNAEYLNPYSDTLVWIPKNSTQVAWLELEDPCTTFITPIANIDYTANSTQDGSGDDLTANISIHEFINYGNAVFINVQNLGDTDAYLTKFHVRGIPTQILKWIRVTATDLPSITRYGIQDFKIENHFIDSEDTARTIAQEELYRRKEAVNLFRINIIGIPHLLCGDVINIEYRAGNYKNYMIDKLNWTFDDGGFIQKLTLVNPYIFPEIKTIDARAYIVDQLQAIQAKGRIS